VTNTDSTIDPNETRDRSFDWTPQLATGETIALATVTIVDRAGVAATNATVVSHSETDTIVTFRLSAATGAEVFVLCRVTTSTGQILDDTWRLLVISH
jgi:hypothetical protein